MFSKLIKTIERMYVGRTAVYMIIDYDNSQVKMYNSYQHEVIHIPRDKLRIYNYKYYELVAYDGYSNKNGYFGYVFKPYKPSLEVFYHTRNAIVKTLRNKINEAKMIVLENEIIVKNDKYNLNFNYLPPIPESERGIFEYTNSTTILQGG